MPDSQTTSVLIVDDERGMRLTLSAILIREGYDVATASDGDQAVGLCHERDFGVVLMDVRMPNLSGIEAFRQIRRHREGARVILMSAYDEVGVKEAALNEGAIAFVDKPLDIEHVIRLVADTAADISASSKGL
jgi:two-component system, NtrC family, response regulator HydG